MEVFLHKICGQPVQPPVSMQLRLAARRSRPRRCTPCKTRCAPPCRTRSSSCRTRWKTSRPMSARTCASAHGRAAALAGISSCASAGAAHTTMRPSWMRRAPSGEHWANADSAIVHADFRGNGLQRLMLEAALPLFPKKITHIGATVSPQNQYSLHNALASGFAIVSRREMYGGHDRYLLAKDL